MAEIPVEKKSSLGWLWALLALLLLALLLWWLLADDEEELVAEPVVVEDQMEPVAARLMVGETVNLEGVEVTELTGDMSFRVMANGMEHFVVFNQDPTPGTPTEGEFDINPGQMVNLTGMVMAADQPLPDGVDATIPTGTSQYIFADSMEIVDRPTM
jgi:hypothetical protein